MAKLENPKTLIQLLEPYLDDEKNIEKYLFKKSERRVGSLHCHIKFKKNQYAQDFFLLLKEGRILGLIVLDLLIENNEVWAIVEHLERKGGQND